MCVDGFNIKISLIVKLFHNIYVFQNITLDTLNIHIFLLANYTSKRLEKIKYKIRKIKKTIKTKSR